MNKNNTPAVFCFDSHSVRTITRDGEIWFVATDVCSAINIGNSRMAIAKLDDDEKGVSSIDTLGGPQEMAIISEPGLYTLVLRCRDAMKEGTAPYRFRKWVNHEVLPAIRKTGQYTGGTAVTLSEADAVNLAGLLQLIPMFEEVQKKAEVIFRETRSPLVGKMHDAWAETGLFAWALRDVGERCAHVRSDQDARYTA